MACYYEGILARACLALTKVVQADFYFLKKAPIKDKKDAMDSMAYLYIRYLIIANRLTDACSGMIYPNIREDIQSLSNMVMGRLLELKHEMVEFELSEFQYLDNGLFNKGLSRWDLELDIPEDYRILREEQLELMNRKLERIIEDEERRKLEEAMAEGEGDSDSDLVIVGRMSDLSEISDFDEKTRGTSSLKFLFGKKQLTAEDIERIEAVKLIQKHERFRTHNLKIQIEREHQKLYEDMMNLRYIPVSDEEKLRAALIIQRHWARYKQKREAKFRITQKRLLYDVYTPSYRDLSHEKALEEVKESRRNRQIESLKALQDAAFVYKLRMERKKDLIQCDLEIELMDYIRNWYETTKQLDQPKLPEWPEEKEYSPTFNYFGLPKKIPSEVYAEEVEIHDVVNVFYGHWFKPLMGSEVITACHWVPPELWVHIKKVLDDLKNSKKKGDKDKSKGKEKEKARQAKLKKEAENQKKLAERKQIGYIPKDSAFLYDMIPASREAWIKYCHKSVTKYNRAQTEDKWLLESKIANDVHRDTRILADKQIRENLILLEMAIKKDKGKKKVKPPMEKKKKTPKPPKTPFDMTGDLESWQLFELMAKKMLIKTYTRTFFKNLIGEYSFNNYELRNIYFEDPPASIGDIYEVIKEYCVFPFANPTIRRTTKLIQSVLFLGPKFYTVPIINAICTETGSLMFNINTLDVADKFEDKKMLIHLLTKVPALFEPAVIYIEDIEKAFWKKVPEEDKEKNPRFIGPLLKKIISAIKQESRVLFLATSEKPWDAKKAKMMKLFTKIIPIPDLDYFTLSSYWRDKLFQQHSVQRQFDFTNLASISKGIKLEDIKGAIDVVMKPERICKLYVKPLKYEELEPFLPAPQADKSYWDWCKKNVPIFKKRTAMLRKEAKERREKEERERKMKKQLEKEKKRGKHK